MLALAKLQAGRLQDARADFNALTLTLGASQGMKTRAQGAIALIDSGQAALVGAVVKAAVVAPPPNAPQGAALFDQAAGADSQAPAQDQSQDASGTPQ
jgi:hypothetical protein